MTPENKQLLRDLLDAHIVNLEGNIAAIEDDPSLILVSEEGTDQLAAQLDLARATLADLLDD